MKLLTLINKRYLRLSLCILLSGGIIFYFILVNILDKQLNEQLYQDKDFFVTHYKTNTLPASDVLLPNIYISEVKSNFKEKIIDTILYHPMEKGWNLTGN